MRKIDLVVDNKRKRIYCSYMSDMGDRRHNCSLSRVKLQICGKEERMENMSSKTDTEVIIGGKVFTLSGYESEEYLQKVASYINNKVNEYNKVDSFRRKPLDTQGVLLQLNIADDYFKAKKQISVLEEELQRKEKELYDLKHELISSQIRLENLEKDSKEMEIQLRENAKQIEKLEREQKNKKLPV